MFNDDPDSNYTMICDDCTKKEIEIKNEII